MARKIILLALALVVPGGFLALFAALALGLFGKRFPSLAKRVHQVLGRLVPARLAVAFAAHPLPSDPPEAMPA